MRIEAFFAAGLVAAAALPTAAGAISGVNSILEIQKENSAKQVWASTKDIGQTVWDGNDQGGTFPAWFGGATKSSADERKRSIKNFTGGEIAFTQGQVIATTTAYLADQITIQAPDTSLNGKKVRVYVEAPKLNGTFEIYKPYGHPTTSWGVENRVDVQFGVGLSNFTGSLQGNERFYYGKTSFIDAPLGYSAGPTGYPGYFEMTLGEATPITLAMLARTAVGCSGPQGCYWNGGWVTGTIDMSVAWGGISAVTLLDGTALQGFSLTSLTGADWRQAGTAAVPEPASWAMMVGGFGLVGGLVRRRRASAAVLA